MPGPLHGFKVVDLTTVVSGPVATQTLADQGADVIKVEAPRGDHARHVATRRGDFSAAFLNNNRNKRSVVLNLKHPDGLSAFKRLAGDADVLVQNFRPGVADRIGVGEATMRDVNPEIVYVSIAGFGFDGPYASKPVFDPLVQAVSGLTTVQAGSDELRPRLVRTILPDKLTGIQVSQAITAALLARERTGKGQHVRLSMLDTVVSFLWSSDMGGHTFVGEESEHERAQSWIDLIYETRDGFITVAVNQNKEWERFAHAAERPDMLDDERFRTPEGRERFKNERLELIQSVLKDSDHGGMARPPRVPRRSVRAGAHPSRDDPASADSGQRPHRGNRPSAGRPPAPPPEPGAILGHRSGTSSWSAGARRAHARDPARARIRR